MGRNTTLSILIPCYNEERRLEGTCQKLLNFSERYELDHEIIFIDDGSTDKTYEILKNFSTKTNKVSIIKNKQNRGKGYSVKRGVQQATGKYVMYIDADLSYSLEVIDRAIDLFGQRQCDLIIGDRTLTESKVVVHYPIPRRISGKLLSMLISDFIIEDIKDSQCGLKFFKTNIAKKIFELVAIPGFGFDIEVLMIASVNKLKIVKVPVILRHSSNSTVRVFEDSVKILANIFAIIYNKHKGNYNFK